MSRHTLFIDGIAFWSPTLNSWDEARAAFRGEPSSDISHCGNTSSNTSSTTNSNTSSSVNGRTLSRPAPALMAANERRRASDSVLVALEVASQAVAASGHHAKDLASVFTSAHGDLPITDALCKTLVTDPLLLSPMRFHHSVHNAASGYWAIASGCTAASTALAGFKASFANGFLEAASQCGGDGWPRLLVGFDTEATGPLASVNRSRGLMGVALVLAPQASAHSLFEVRWDVQRLDSVQPDAALSASASAHAGSGAPGRLRSAAARTLANNAMADALPLFEALAERTAQTLGLALGPALQLCLDWVPIVTTGSESVAA
jgi:hypothetical protein